MHRDDEQEEQEVLALLRRLDHSPPQLDARSVARRAHRSRYRPVRRAAGVLLALGVAGAAYALPGSPLPALVRAAVTRIAGTADRSPTARFSGIAIPPGRGLVIQFTSTQADGRVRVSLTDGPDVRVRAPIGAATFTSDVERLVIDNQGAGATFNIDIPRMAQRVEIRVEGTMIFVKEGSRVTSEAGMGPGPFDLLLRRPSRRP